MSSSGRFPVVRTGAADPGRWRRRDPLGPRNCVQSPASMTCIVRANSGHRAKRRRPMLVGHRASLDDWVAGLILDVSPADRVCSRSWNSGGNCNPWTIGD